MPVLCHASYCVPYIVERPLRVVSAWLLRQCGFLRPGCPRACGCCGVNSYRSQGVPLPGDCTHSITLLPRSWFLVPRRTKHQELRHVKQLFPLQISIASSGKFTWNSSEQRTSRKMELEMPSQTAVLTLLMEIQTKNTPTTALSLSLTRPGIYV